MIMQGALKGCLVLDLSRLLPGPYCSMILADHGARVIAVEDRRFEKEALPTLTHINRNKEHVTLNLKTEKGKEIFNTLAAKADVILEGFRPGVTDRLGVGYASVKKINPRIIYCSITGFGQTGPFKDQAGHDVNFQGLGGALSMIGPKSGAPCIPGVPLGDVGGGLNAAVGILLAMYAREKTGQGQYIDISMTDAVTSLLPIAAGWNWMFGQSPERGNFTLAHRYACYNLYETADGKYMAVGALEARFWKTICDYFEKPEYAPLQYDEDRREEIKDFIAGKFKEKTRDQWMAVFSEMDACVSGILDMDEALSGENARDRQTVETVTDANGNTIKGLGIPVKLDQTPGSVRTAPPAFGENTASVLRELGYNDQEIADFVEQGIV